MLEMLLYNFSEGLVDMDPASPKFRLTRPIAFTLPVTRLHISCEKGEIRVAVTSDIGPIVWLQEELEACIRNALPFRDRHNRAQYVTPFTFDDLVAHDALTRYAQKRIYEATRQAHEVIVTASPKPSRT